MTKKLLAMVFALALAPALAQNPYLPLWEHLPDGEPRVFEDPDCPGKMRAYIVGSHDVKYTEYCGNDIRIWSAPVEDLTDWRDEGPVFSHYVNGKWDTMYAPDLVEVKDKATGKKTYWLYPHSRGWRRVAMVCKGDRPDGPFTPVNLNADGTACVEGSLIDFDPSVFVENITDRKDPDYARGFRAYVFYGFRHSTAYELDPDNMYGVRPGTEIHDYFIPASERYGVVRDPEGTQYPALCEGQNPGDFNFFEASSIRQVGNKYVMVFSGYSGPEYGQGSTNSALRYAYGDSPLGPWRSGGVLVDSRGIVPNEDGTHLVGTNAGHNTHGSIQEINGQWYVFYHRPPRGFGFARQAMVAPIKIEWDKKPVAKGGQVRIAAYDPYARNNEWTAEASDGTKYTGAEVTSEGFNIFGLPPYAYYSAGIACYMSDQRWLQDNFDVWNNSMDLAGVTNGGVVGFKYFGFGGLDRHTKGIRPFEGTRKGDNTRLCICMTPSGKGAFRLRVMLDGPYDNAAWRGREIAALDVPADAAREATTYEVAVPAVEGLTGKHAVYLVVEGAGGGPLVDIHGLGFSKPGKPCRRPAVPAVSLSVDGKAVAMPARPVFSTGDNGLMDLTRYQVYAPLTDRSVIKATASGGDVGISIGQVTDGRATVRCSYNGKEKVYLIN
ncbi:MAG: hypothetical protein ACI3X9_01850 [Bacteroidaceae bacterium]